MRLPTWWPDWRGAVIIVVASGPSAGSIDLSIAKGKARIITVNNSWRLAPWAAALLAADYAWWQRYRDEAVCAGLRITTSARAAEEFGELHLPCLKVDQFQAKPGLVGFAGNSGFQAFNFAAQLAPRRIALVGFDATLEHGIHWHGGREGLKDPNGANVGRWRRAMDAAAPEVNKLGIDVVNCSPISALTAYRRAPLAEALI